MLAVVMASLTVLVSDDNGKGNADVWGIDDASRQRHERCADGGQKDKSCQQRVFHGGIIRVLRRGQTISKRAVKV